MSIRVRLKWERYPHGSRIVDGLVRCRNVKDGGLLEPAVCTALECLRTRLVQLDDLRGASEVHPPDKRNRHGDRITANEAGVGRKREGQQPSGDEADTSEHRAYACVRGAGQGRDGWEWPGRGWGGGRTRRLRRA